MLYISVQETSKQRIIKTKGLLKEGLTYKEIAVILGIGLSGVYNMVKRNNLMENEYEYKGE